LPPAKVDKPSFTLKEHEIAMFFTSGGRLNSWGLIDLGAKCPDNIFDNLLTESEVSTGKSQTSALPY